MTRQTSIEAYQKIIESGRIGKARLLVYVRLFHHGPMTAGELFLDCQQLTGGHRLVKGSVCARLGELRTQGLVMETGEEKVCALTGHSAML